MTEQQQEMVLVPRVPTKEMLKTAWADALAEDAEGVWASMIRAFYNSHSIKPIEETIQVAKQYLRSS